jgi:hypothetical protein
MKKIGAAISIVLCLCLSTTKSMADSYLPFSIASTSPATSCPYGSSYSDGCTGAYAGTPQYPNLLAGYAIRPAWNVAGVDYAVGLPEGTVLSDPTTASLPAGCTYSAVNLRVTCNGNNITVQGYDFSLHSTKLNVTGAGNLVTKNKFGGALCTDPTIAVLGVGSTTISHNTIDGGGAICTAPDFGAIIYGTYLNGATIVHEYNWIKNIPADAMDNAGPATGSAILIDRFNLIDTQGWTGHPDGIQLNGGNFTNSFYSFNTYRNPDIGQPVASGTQPVHIETQLVSAITNYTVNNNVVLTPGTGWQTANIDIACKQNSADPVNNPNTGFSAYGNYIDATGALSALSNGYGCVSTSWGSPTPNYNIVTGSELAVP